MNVGVVHFELRGNDYRVAHFELRGNDYRVAHFELHSTEYHVTRFGLIGTSCQVNRSALLYWLCFGDAQGGHPHIEKEDDGSSFLRHPDLRCPLIAKSQQLCSRRFFVERLTSFDSHWRRIRNGVGRPVVKRF